MKLTTDTQAKSKQCIIKFTLARGHLYKEAACVTFSAQSLFQVGLQLALGHLPTLESTASKECARGQACIYQKCLFSLCAVLELLHSGFRAKS